MAFAGSCLCGAVGYTIHRSHLNAVHCYCGMCRKAHGTAFSTHVIARPDQVSWRSGQDKLVRYQSSATGFREFCGACGTHIVVHGQSGDGTLAFPAGTLDGDPELTIVGHIFAADRVSWYEIADALPQHVAWPPGFGPDANES